MSFKDKLKNLILENSISQTELAEKTLINRVYISKMLSGERTITEPKLKTILIKGFDFKPSEAEELINKWKLEETLPKVSSEGITEVIMKSYKLGENPFIDLMPFFKKEEIKPFDPEKDTIKLPYFGVVACGSLEDADRLGTYPMPIAQLNPKKKYFVLKADGISMAPEIKSGDIILIEECTENRSGEIMLFELQGKCALGYLYIGDRYIEIQKENKTTQSIKVRDQDVRIKGWVKGYFRSYS